MYRAPPERHTSMPPRPQVGSATPYLHTSTSQYLQRASRASIPPCLHVSTPTARHQTSRHPYLHVATPTACLRTSIPPCSTSSRLQRASRAAARCEISPS